MLDLHLSCVENQLHRLRYIQSISAAIQRTAARKLFDDVVRSQVRGSQCAVEIASVVADVLGIASAELPVFVVAQQTTCPY